MAKKRTALVCLALIATTTSAANLSFITRYDEPAGPGDFGVSIAAGGSTLVVGGPHEGGGGAVKIIDLASGSTIGRAEGSPTSGLGTASVVLGDRVAAGAPTDDNGSGSVTLFALTGESLETLANPLPVAGSFGASLAGTATRLVVGAPAGVDAAGAVHLFDLAGPSLALTMQSPVPSSGDGFGTAVALSEVGIVVGAPGAAVQGAEQAGAAFLFDSSTGSLLDAFTAPVPTAGAEFGASLAVRDGNLLVGAPGEAGVGAAYLFDLTAHAFIRKLSLPALAAGAKLGASVALGTDAFVGAPGVTDGLLSVPTGAVYRYDIANGTIIQQLIEPSPVGARFGSAMAVAGPSDVVVGSPLLRAAARFSDRCGTCEPCQMCDLTAGCVAVAACTATVWCVGDSVTGLYAPHLAQRAPAWQVANFGLAGELTTEGLARLSMLLDEAASRPQVAVLLFGTNDITVYHLLGRDTALVGDLVAMQIAAMRQLLDAHGIASLVGLPIAEPRSVVLASATDPSLADYVKGFASLRDALRPMRPVVDFRLRTDAQFADLVHPSAVGADNMARRAYSGVRRVLRTLTP